MADNKTKKNYENLTSNILELELKVIKLNPTQPRKVFDDKKIKELSESIKKNGIIQPILVRKKDENYEIIAGERRYRAAKLAGLKTVPAILKDTDDKLSLELAIIENIQRENLNPLEEGLAYETLIQKYSYTQEELAKNLGKKRSTISNTLRLLKLPEEIKEMIVEGEIKEGHARAILALIDESSMLKLSKKIIEENMSVRKTEEIVKEEKKNKIAKKNILEEKTIEIEEIENKLVSYLGTKVKIKNEKTNKGKIEIEFYSDGDLERILETIGIK